MKVAVIGSRSIEYDKLQMKAYELLCEYIPANCTEIVSGGAMGVDRLAEIYARKNNIPIKVFLPDYDKYGKRAPKVRNEQIVEYSDEVIAFWDATSTGTAHTVATAVMKGVTVHVVRIQKETEF